MVPGDSSATAAFAEGVLSRNPVPTPCGRGIELTTVNLLGAYLPDGTAAQEGRDYYVWYDRGQSGVFVPVDTPLWFLVESSQTDRRRSFDFKTFFGVNVSSSSAVVHVGFCGPWHSLAAKPSCPVDIPENVYASAISLAPEADRQRWHLEDQRLEVEGRRQELARYRHEVSELKVKATQLRNRSLGESQAVAELQQPLHAIANYEAGDDVSVLSAWVAATHQTLAAAEGVIVDTERTELAPFRAVRGVADNTQARVVRSSAEGALAAAGGDVRKAINLLLPQAQQNRGFPKGRDLELAISFLRTRLASAAAPSGLTVPTPAFSPVAVS